MLYVFYVNTGSTLKLAMSHTTGSVVALKTVLHEQHRVVAPSQQVLLTLSGVRLTDSRRVASYQAGADTNPILLYSKCAVFAPPPTSPPPDALPPASPTALCASGSDSMAPSMPGCSELLLELRHVQTRAPTEYSTLLHVYQLARRLHEYDHRLVQYCTRLISDQHTQHQALQAASANTQQLRAHVLAVSEHFRRRLHAHETQSAEVADILARVPATLRLLATIPLPATEGVGVASDTAECDSASTLLDWITAQVCGTDSLERVCSRVSACMQALATPEVRSLHAEVSDLGGCEDTTAHICQIRGLTERLQKLDQIRARAEQSLSEQHDVVRTLNQQMARASLEREDQQLVAELCRLHLAQLQTMAARHTQLEQTHVRCVQAKRELCCSVESVLALVASVQSAYSHRHSRLVVSLRRLRQIDEYLRLLRAVLCAPGAFYLGLLENQRRAAYAERVGKWSAQLADYLGEGVCLETALRQKFSEKFDNHFVRRLLTGLCDVTASTARPAKLPEMSSTEGATDSGHKQQQSVVQLCTCLQRFDRSDRRLQPVSGAYITRVRECLSAAEAVSWPDMEADCTGADTGVRLPMLLPHTQLLSDIRACVRDIQAQVRELSAHVRDCLRETCDHVTRVLHATADCRHPEVCGGRETSSAEIHEQQREEADRLSRQEQKEEEVDRQSRQQQKEEDRQSRQEQKEEEVDKQSRQQQKEEVDRQSRQQQKEVDRQSRQELVDHYECEMAAMREQHALALAEALERVGAEHRSELLTLRSRFRLVTSERPASPTLPLSCPAHVPVCVSGLCAPGDAVLLVWDAKHMHYRVYTHDPHPPTLQFVVSRCLPELRLREGQPATSLAEVTHTELCQIRKHPNRFNVAKETHFYRVKVRPFVLGSGQCALSRSRQNSGPLRLLEQHTDTQCVCSGVSSFDSSVEEASFLSE